MLTIKVTWHALKGCWLAQPLEETGAPEPVLLEEWAEEQPDLLSVRLVLHAANYSCHWVNMPGVSGRNLVRALPFALEENLIDDLDNYQIVAAGKVDGRVRAYVISVDLIERLLETCHAHHVNVSALIPETALLPDGNAVVRDGADWLVSLPGRLEGRIMEFALTPVLESVLDEWAADSALTIHAMSVDQSRLLMTSIETGFPDAFPDISHEVNDAVSLLSSSIDSSATNLLTGQFQQREASDNKPAAWWVPLAGMTAACLVLVGVYLAVDNHQMKAQAIDVNKRSVALYKQLFPGERIRMLERQFRAKLGEESPVVDVGFVSLMHDTAKAYSAANLKKLNITSVRYNERLRELMVEVSATNLNDIQSLRQALEKQGLTAEVASASNEKNSVKGRLKVGVSA